MYSASFGVTLIALSLITTVLIMTVVSNVVLSLGMVGALSIVRFRTRHQGTHGHCLLFWAIAVGIVLAAGLIPLAVFGSAFIGAVLWCFPKKRPGTRRIFLVVHCENSSIEQQVRVFVDSQVKRLNLKSKSVDNGCVELNYEIRLKEDNSAFVNELEAMPGVSQVVLVSYNGDYMG